MSIAFSSESENFSKSSKLHSLTQFTNELCYNFRCFFSRLARFCVQGKAIGNFQMPIMSHEIKSSIDWKALQWITGLCWNLENDLLRSLDFRQTWNCTKSGKMFLHPWKVFSRYIQHSLWIGAPAEGISFPLSSSWSALGFALTTFDRLTADFSDQNWSLGQPNCWLRYNWPAILSTWLGFVVFVEFFGWFWLKLIFFASKVSLSLVKRRNEIWLVVGDFFSRLDHGRRAAISWLHLTFTPLLTGKEPPWKKCRILVNKPTSVHVPNSTFASFQSFPVIKGAHFPQVTIVVENFQATTDFSTVSTNTYTSAGNFHTIRGYSRCTLVVRS